MPDGFDPLSFFVGVNNFLSSILGSLIAFINAILNFLLRLVLFIYSVLVLVVRFLARAFPAVFRAARHVISDIIHGRFVHLFEDYLRLKAKLDRLLKPVLDILRAIRRIQDFIFNTYIRPILNLIQQIRAVLQLFRILHLRFAEALDRRLTLIETRIFEAWNSLRVRVNQISTIIELIVDPTRVLRQRVAIARIIRSVGTIINVLERATHRSLLPREKERQDRSRKLFVGFRQRGPDGKPIARVLSEQERERDQLIRRRLEELSGVTLRRRP